MYFKLTILFFMSTLIAFIDVRTLASAEANNNKSFYFISICGHTPIRIGEHKNSRRFECFTAFFSLHIDICTGNACEIAIVCNKI